MTLVSPSSRFTEQHVWSFPLFLQSQQNCEVDFLGMGNGDPTWHHPVSLLADGGFEPHSPQHKFSIILPTHWVVIMEW